MYLNHRKRVLAGVGKPMVFTHGEWDGFATGNFQPTRPLPATCENHAYQHENDDFNGTVLMLFPRLFHTVFSLFLPSVSK
jgi:hypothetical protein